jgi:hypothetical protein
MECAIQRNMGLLRVFVKTNGDAQTEYVIHGLPLQSQLKNWSPS